MHRIQILAACLVLLGGISGARPADPVKEVPARKGVTLTAESMGSMLEGMGLSPKAGKSSNGHAWYDVEMDLDGWMATIRVSLSPNGRVIWLKLNLGTLPPMDQISTEKLINLMRKSGTASKAQFCVRENYIILLQPMDNWEIKPARMLAELQEFYSVAKASSKDCNLAQSKPLAPLTPAQQAELTPLSGTWKVMSATANDKPLVELEGKGIVIEIKDGKFTLCNNKGEALGKSGDIRVDGSKSPKYFDLVGPDGTVLGICKLEGETLTLCLSQLTEVRPQGFVSTAAVLLVLKREVKS